MAATGQVSQAETEEHPPLPIASLQLRIVAFVLDCIVMLGVFMLFFAVGGTQLAARGDNPPDSAVYLGIGITLASLFPFAPLFFAFLWAWRSQSLGMMAVGLIITNAEGYRLSYTRALFRALVWPLSMLPLGVGIMPMFFDERRRALHDRLAGTVVRELR